MIECQEENMHEPIIEKSQHNNVVEIRNTGCASESVKDRAKHLRRSEREFAVDHANLHSEMPWYENLTAKDAATSSRCGSG